MSQRPRLFCLSLALGELLRPEFPGAGPDSGPLPKPLLFFDFFSLAGGQ